MVDQTDAAYYVCSELIQGAISNARKIYRFPATHALNVFERPERPLTRDFAVKELNYP